MSARVGTLLFVGLGLIGGSLAAALRGTGFAARMTAFNRNRATLDYALGAGLIDAAPASLEQAIAEADLIVVGVPTLTVGRIFAAIREHGRPDVLITDVASVKGSVVAAAREAFGAVPPRLIPGHPIAGAEKSGVEAARADLFVRHRVILTPLEDSDPEALATIDAMWRLTGADVVRMDVAEHDRVLAMTSHLPHLLAFALVDSLANQPASDEIFRCAAGGFPRLHAHRLQRRGDVARHRAGQSRCTAGRAGRLHAHPGHRPRGGCERRRRGAGAGVRTSARGARALPALARAGRSS